MTNGDISYSVSLANREMQIKQWDASSHLWDWQHLSLILSSAGEDVGGGQSAGGQREIFNWNVSIVG